jgi:hypothetical protein
MESVINNLLKQKAPSSGGLAIEFHQIFKKEIMPTHQNLLQKIRAEKRLLNTFLDQH